MSARYEKFDILRGLAIVGVILIHITAPLATYDDVLAIVVNQISRFAVPVYFILSGWGLTIADSYKRSASYGDFLKKRFLGIFPQYFLWNIIYLVYTDVWNIPGDLSWGMLYDITKSLLMGTIYNHLYFVPVILIFYAAYPFLLKIANKYGIMISLVITMLSQVSDLWIEHEYFYMNKNVFNWLFFFIFGVWLAKNFTEKVQYVQKYKVPIILGTLVTMMMVIFTPFVVGGVFDYNLALASTRPSVIFYSLMVVLLIMVVPFRNERLNPIFLTLSKYSFYIYLSHYLFVDFLRTSYVNAGLHFNTVIYILLFLLLVTLASLAVGVVTRKIEQR